MTNQIAELSARAKEIEQSAIRLDNDVYGNPRYYVSVISFTSGERDPVTMLLDMYRPVNATKYRGKKYGAGWVFQSYNLRRSIQVAIETEHGLEHGALN